jgi:hypothetical protein
LRVLGSTCGFNCTIRKHLLYWIMINKGNLPFSAPNQSHHHSPTLTPHAGQLLLVPIGPIWLWPYLVLYILLQSLDWSKEYNSPL